MDWIGNHAWESWLALSLVLVGFELVSLDLIFAMVAVGALAAAVTALLNVPGAVQFAVAAIAAAGCLFLVRPQLVQRFHGGPTLLTGADALIGQRAHVLTELESGKHGRVKIGGDEWTGAPYDELDVLEPGELVEVVEIKGATAYVRRI